MKKKISTYWRAIIILLSASLLLFLLSLSDSVCDWYTDNIYGFICDGISYITGWIPFALGEIMMYAGVLLVVFGIIFLLLLIILRKNEKYRKFCLVYFKTFLMLLVCIVFIYMPTWFVPFRGSVLGKGENSHRKEFTFEEIRTLTQFAADGANSAAKDITVNADSSVNFMSNEEALPLIADAMRNISDEFPRLKGYYPPVKTALCSDILDRMGIGGYNYPFTMEPTANKYSSPVFIPELYSHEYSHHKGYYKENEANFLSQLALSRSENPFLRFSGYIEMYYFLSDSMYKEMNSIIEEMIKNGELTSEKIQSSNNIYEDIFGSLPFLTKRCDIIKNSSSAVEKEIYDADSHPVENMPEVIEVIEETADFGWETQGEILKENTYNGVVLLLLQYFDGVLY